MSDLPEGFWWHTDRETGAKLMYPKMTLIALGGPPPYPDKALFRCSFCKLEGTARYLMHQWCDDPEAYHGGQLKPKRTI